MSKHTPGPWKVVRPGHLHPTKYLCVQIGADESYTTLEMLPADARLVAAAPALLEALTEILARIGDAPTSANLEYCLPNARAAVALATGEVRP